MRKYSCMRTIVLILVAGTSAVIPLQNEVKYDNYKVYRFVPQTKSELKLLSNLEKEFPGQLSFWQNSDNVGMPFDIMISPQIHNKVLFTLKSIGMSAQKPWIGNVQTRIDEEKEANDVCLAMFPSLTWACYYGYDAIMKFLDERVASHHEIATLKTYGKSFEGRDLKVIQISTGGNGKRPIIFLDANIHAREWITNAVATYVINELLNGKESGGVRSLLNTFDFHIAPMLNPDGYEFTRNVDRLWRKTRSNCSPTSGICCGADPNRNFGFQWNTGGSSSNCNDDTYMGDKPFSESEVKSFADYYTGIQGRTAAYLSLHCYSQFILIPFGTTTNGNSRCPDYINHMRVAKLVRLAIAKRNKTDFQPGNIVDILYVASGSSGDWVKGTHNTTLVYTFELRDQGKHGFLLPPEQIEPSALEFIDGLIALCQDLKVQLANRKNV